jgi:hypothetical protein
MSDNVTFRNAITGDRQEVGIDPGQTVRDAVEASGLVAAGNAFSVRDKRGEVVDDQMAAQHANTVLTVGLPGDRVAGGGAPADGLIG